jgi:hypothetical protein
MFFIHSSVSGHLNSLYNLSIVDSAAVNVSMKVSLLEADLDSCGYVPGRCMAGLYGSYTFRGSLEGPPY